MRKLVEQKLNFIADVWNNYIWEYKYFSSQINFNNEVKKNYFGHILHYFKDTFDIIYGNHSGSLIDTISFLQAIYIQQDFLKELFYIFEIKIEKDDLRGDENYIINRKIRNEFVGHPISRDPRGKEVNGIKPFISSSLYLYTSNATTVSYIKYYKQNNYKLEKVEYNKTEIIKRHTDFLHCYFDKIINKLESLLVSFHQKIEEFENSLTTKTFEELLCIVNDSFEYFERSNILYVPEYLVEIYEMEDEHERYANAIRIFQIELRNYLNETKTYTKELLNKIGNNNESNNTNQYYSNINLNIQERLNELDDKYHYYFEKLANKRDFDDFIFHSSCLADKCNNNSKVLEEIENMRINYSNDLEYYCSLNFIKTILVCNF